MVSAEEKLSGGSSRQSVASASLPDTVFPQTFRPAAEGSQMPVQNDVPTLTLYNPTLNIRMVGVNGAVIGRKQGPYQQLFVDNRYISGLHAQLIYKPDTGWCIIDKHSSNGTKLNQRDLLPDVPMSMKSGDIVTLANVNLQVSIS
jgi:pSer/pThr/pTyr-binding forkhead associated (FHA) protein